MHVEVHVIRGVGTNTEPQNKISDVHWPSLILFRSYDIVSSLGVIIHIFRRRCKVPRNQVRRIWCIPTTAQSCV